MITILLKPNGGPRDSWPPVQIHGSQSTINRLISQGWVNPAQSSLEPVSIDPSAELINLNTATVKEMTALKGVGIAKANLINQARPIKDLPDLIDKVEGVDWLEIESLIAF